MSEVNVPVDPHQADVVQTERIFAAVEQNGAVALPDLIAVDLCALGAAEQVVFDAPVWQAWLQLPDAYRDELAADAFRGLTQRRLMDPAAPTPQSNGQPVARVAPPLALIMMTRAQPAFVIQCSLGGEQRGAPRMYGIAEQDAGLRAVLVERASNERIGLGVSERVTLSSQEDQARGADLNQLYKYLLLAPRRAVDLLSSWLTEADRAGRSLPRVLDLYRHRAAEQITRAQLIVHRQRDNRFTVTREFSGADGQPRPDLGKDEVAGEVAELVIAGTTP